MSICAACGEAIEVTRGEVYDVVRDRHFHRLCHEIGTLAAEAIRAAQGELVPELSRVPFFSPFLD